MRSQVIILALFAIVGLASPAPIVSDIVPRGCNGGEPGKACPDGFFQVYIVLPYLSSESEEIGCLLTNRGHETVPRRMH